MTSKSPRRVMLAGWYVGRQVLEDYPHRFAPKKFTQPQLFACLVLKTFFKTDYRGIEQILEDCPDLCDAIGLTDVPDHSTLHKAVERFFGKPLTDKALDATIRLMMKKPKSKKLAADSSGFLAHHTSSYFVKRRGRTLKNKAYQTMTYRRYPKLGIAADCKTHLITAVHTSRGPTPDIKHIKSLMRDAARKVDIDTVLADAGYDAEWVHELLRNHYDVKTLIRAGIGRPTAKAPAGYWRRWMSQHLHHTTYGQRWQVETVFSMIKRNLGDALNAATYWSQNRALNLMAVTHNIMILYAMGGFRQSRTGPIN